MNQPKVINISSNKPLFNLVFILVDSSQLRDFHESTQQKSSDWRLEAYEDYYLLIGNDPIILLNTFNNFSLNFNVKIKLLTPIYAEIPMQISGIQSQIFPKITLDNDYQLSCLGTKISIRCTPLSAKTLSLVEKLPFEKTSEPLGVRYKKFDSLFSSTKIQDVNIWKYKKNNLVANYNFKKRKRRQDIVNNYLENGSFYIFNVKKFKKSNNRLFGKIGTYEMDKKYSFQLDDYVDLKIIKSLI